ncbi:MAG UNVERIFIED_CONTAM: hypothetical protein LVR18_04955 [Planctomycetaceae bacterium]|jgi:hypothetical protein
MKQHDVTRPQATMLLLKTLNIGWLHEWTDSIRGLIEKMATIDDTGFTAKLPWFNHVRPRKSKWSRFFTFELRTENGMRRNVHLSSCISVHQQQINVERALRANRNFRDSLKSWKWCRRPCCRIVG